MARRYVEQHITSDKDFLHLEGPYDPQEDRDTRIRRRILRQWLWRGLIGSCVDDWGRFCAEPEVMLGVLAIDLQPPPDWLLEAVESALDHFEKNLHWIGRYSYGHAAFQKQAGVVWAWPKWHSLTFAAKPRYQGVPLEMAQQEAMRRGLPHQKEYTGGLHFERFVALHTWYGSLKGLKETRPELFQTKGKRWEPGT